MPIHGKAAHNGAFLVSIGNLVVNWANNESVFMAMLQVLIEGGKFSAAIIWHSQRTTLARLELIDRLCRDRVQDAQLRTDVNRAIASFKGLTRARNFYCHATYSYDSALKLDSATGVTFNQEDDPLNFETKRMDLATLNEIGFVSTELGKLNRALWDLVVRLQNALGGQRVTLPELLRALKSSPDDRPHSGTDGTPAEPQKPSPQ